MSPKRRYTPTTLLRHIPDEITLYHKQTNSMV
jgi:hypothetical protein